MWSSTTRQINYGHTPEMGMVGLRDVFFVAPASTFHHSNLNEPGITEHMTGSNPAGATVGVIPVLAGSAAQIGATTDEELLNRSRAGGIQFWQSQHSQDYMKKPMFLDQTTTANLLQSGGGGGGIGGSSSSASTVTCQDCGNQAKKDCSYARCRACCKSRGFDCSTHVKSTWVPAARRRERQLMSGGGAAPPAGSSASTSGSKKPKLITSQTANSHTSTSTSSSHQDPGFKDGLPGEVRAQAVFKCVKVTALEDGDDEYAYQGMVKISGHVFKGFLYDHGTEGREGYPNMSDLHLGGGGSGNNNNGGGNGGGGRNEGPVLDPSDVYAAASGGGLFGGTSYGNPIN